MAKKTGLGMGLDALFADNSNENRSASALRISEIEPNRSQPRQYFDEDSINALAESIKRHGLAQPILVRPLDSGNYQIVAGERRYRACKLLEMAEIPVVVMELSDIEAAQIALIENIQREDLNPIEEAKGYRELMDVYGMTQEDLSAAVGKSRSAIANAVRLLKLPEPMKDMLKSGELSAGQAKAISAAKSEPEMLDLAVKASNGKLTVRAIERMTAVRPEPEKIGDDRKKARKFLTEVEISLREALKRQVTISSKDGSKGAVTIAFFDKEDLLTLAGKLSKS